MLQSPAEGRLVSYSLPAERPIPAAVFLRSADGRERFFWQRGSDGPIFAGHGIAMELMAWGPQRFRESKEKIEGLFGNAMRLAEQPDFAAPRFFGGFAFQDDFTPDRTWAAFHPAHFILPHYQLVTTQSRTWLTINAILSDDEDLAELELQLHEALAARLDVLSSAALKEPAPQALPSDVRINYPLTFEDWQDSIDQAIARFESSDLKKVVLSRVCELRAKERIDIGRVLEYVNKHYSECTRFLFEPRPSHVFYGATPELLVQSKGDEVTTMALAGSIRRGANPAEDAALGRQLLNSTKDRLEHALVVDSIRRRLLPFDAQLKIADGPRVYRLSYIQHLWTPIEGRLRHKTGVLPLLEALHPTPALGGSPRDLALDFIREVETVPRGWYAGPVGWVDAAMDGQFAVAIRSAVAQERRVWLYAGAGIVPGSQADKEWLETALKFEPMLAALGVNNEAVGTVGKEER
jgi:menaquinone-specific isochorismate synthase